MREHRTREGQTLLVTVVAAALAALALLAIGRAQAGSEPQTPAELWLSWSPEARAEYVQGYLSGFLEGKRAACSFYEEKVAAAPQKPVPPDKLPRQACLAAQPDFKEPYFQTYVDAITNYYTKYPHDRQAGIPRILLELASPPSLTVDQIHEKLTR